MKSLQMRRNSLGKQKTYAWEFKVQMVHLLSRGNYTVSHISWDDHVTRSLLYAWVRLYQERSEAALAPSREMCWRPFKSGCWLCYFVVFSDDWHLTDHSRRACSDTWRTSSARALERSLSCLWYTGV